jgi:hypothetical protein
MEECSWNHFRPALPGRDLPQISRAKLGSGSECKEESKLQNLLTILLPSFPLMAFV